MKHLHWILCLALLLQACKEKSFSYSVADKESYKITGELWKEMDTSYYYTDIQLTDSYYVFADYKHDTIVQVYAKNNPVAPVACGLAGEESNCFRSVEFVRSNTRYPSDKDDIWIVDDKNTLKQVACRDGTLQLKQQIPLSGIYRSTNYHFTQDELYVTLSSNYRHSAFYFYRPDSGYYWVDMHGVSLREHKGNPHAFLSHLAVNEQANATVCAFRFLNKVHFFDLRGNLVREAIFGSDSIKPRNKSDRPLDYANSLKCFIDIYGTSRYVYCLYDGSPDFSRPSRIVMFDWNGKHVKTLQADRPIKKIAVDPHDAYFIAIASNRQGGRDVMRYDIK